jgi:hypothetical protein
LRNFDKITNKIDSIYSALDIYNLDKLSEQQIVNSIKELSELLKELYVNSVCFENISETFLKKEYEKQLSTNQNFNSFFAISMIFFQKVQFKYTCNQFVSMNFSFEKIIKD